MINGKPTGKRSTDMEGALRTKNTVVSLWFDFDLSTV